jgi:hypothetical protein
MHYECMRKAWAAAENVQYVPPAKPLTSYTPTERIERGKHITQTLLLPTEETITVEEALAAVRAHGARTTPFRVPLSDKPRGPRGPYTCKNCGEKGHQQRKCKKPPQQEIRA